MKRIMALVLSIALLLGVATAIAEEKQNLGMISVNGAFDLKAELPKGYKVSYQQATQDEVIASLVNENDKNAPLMMLNVAYDETYADVDRMNDLTQEELEIIENTFTEQDPTVEISYETTSYGTLVLVAKQLEKEQDYLELFSIYKGYFIEFVVTAPYKAEDRNLSEEQIASCLEFLSELEFIPVKSMDLVNKSLIANIEKYDEAGNTITLSLFDYVHLDKKEVKKLKAGSELHLGDTTIEVNKVDKDKDNVYINGDEVELIYSHNTKDYTAYTYDAPYLKSVGEYATPLNDNIIFEDDIDKTTGAVLDTPVTYTMDEFKQAIKDSSVIGFNSNNILASFDENGSLVSIERFYAPWQ